MSFQLSNASDQHKAVINNLMQFYIYDFSEFLDLDVKEDGLFASYHRLDDFWNSETKFAYLIQRADRCIGFALVEIVESQYRTHFSIAEFFVLKKYRRNGIGKAVANQLFDLHKGNWEVFQQETNIPAQLFWTRVIDEYTAGNFTRRSENGKCIQVFESV